MRSDPENPFPRMEWRMELVFSLSKGLGPPGIRCEDWRVEGERIGLWTSFPIPIILGKLGFPNGPWEIVFIEKWDHTGPSGPRPSSGMECSNQWCSYLGQGEGKGPSKNTFFKSLNWSYPGLALGTPRNNSILELGLEIPKDSSIKIASNLEEREGTH